MISICLHPLVTEVRLTEMTTADPGISPISGAHPNKIIGYLTDNHDGY